MAAILQRLENKQAILSDKVKAQALITSEFIKLLNPADNINILDTNAIALALELAQASQHPIQQYIASKHGAGFINQCLDASTKWLKSTAEFLPSTELVSDDFAASSQPLQSPSAQLEQMTRDFLLNLYSQAQTEEQIKYIHRCYWLILHPDRLKSGLLYRVGESLNDCGIYCKQLNKSNQLKFLLDTITQVPNWSQPVMAWFNFVMQTQETIRIEELLERLKALTQTPSLAKKLPVYLKANSALELGENIIMDIRSAHQDPEKYISEYFDAFNKLAQELADKQQLLSQDEDSDKAACSSTSTSTDSSSGKQKKIEIEQHIIAAMTKALLPLTQQDPQLAKYRLSLLIDLLDPAKKAPLPKYIQQVRDGLGSDELKQVLIQCKQQISKKLEQTDDLLTIIKTRHSNASTVFEKLLYKSLLNLINEIYKTNKAGEAFGSKALAKVIPFIIATGGTSAIASLYAEELVIITALSLFCKTSKNPVINGIGTRLLYLSLTIPVLSANGHYLLLRGMINSAKFTHSLYQLYIKAPAKSEIVHKEKGSGLITASEFSTSTFSNIAAPLLQRDYRVTHKHRFTQFRFDKHPYIEAAVKEMLAIEQNELLSGIDKLNQVKDVLQRLKNMPKIYASKTKIAIDKSFNQLVMAQNSLKSDSSQQLIDEKVKQLTSQVEKDIKPISQSGRYLNWSSSATTTALTESSSSLDTVSDAKDRSLTLAGNP